MSKSANKLIIKSNSNSHQAIPIWHRPVDRNKFQVVIKNLEFVQSYRVLYKSN